MTDDSGYQFRQDDNFIRLFVHFGWGVAHGTLDELSSLANQVAAAWDRRSIPAKEWTNVAIPERVQSYGDTE
jgi:hypothetical protein